jgi:hypothetical protein
MRCALRTCERYHKHNQDIKGISFFAGKGIPGDVGITDMVYEIGCKSSKGLKQTMKIVFDAVLQTWNYRDISVLP